MPSTMVAPWLSITENDVLIDKLVLAVQGATSDHQKAKELVNRTFSRPTDRKFAGTEKDKARRLDAFNALCKCDRHGEGISFLRTYYRTLNDHSAADPEIEVMAVKRIACLCQKPGSTACD